MLELLHSKYATLIFKSLGILAIIVVAFLIIKIYKRNKKEIGETRSGLDRLFRNAKYSPHKEIIKLVAKLKCSPVACALWLTDRDQSKEASLLTELSESLDYVYINDATALLHNHQKIIIIYNVNDSKETPPLSFIKTLFHKGYIKSPQLICHIDDYVTCSEQLNTFFNAIVPYREIYKSFRLYIDTIHSGASKYSRLFGKVLRIKFTSQSNIEQEIHSYFSTIQVQVFKFAKEIPLDNVEFSQILSYSSQIEYRSLSCLDTVQAILSSFSADIIVDYSLPMASEPLLFSNDEGIHKRVLRKKHIIYLTAGILALGCSSVLAYDLNQVTKFNSLYRQSDPFRHIDNIDKATQIYQRLQERLSKSLYFHVLYPSDISASLRTDFGLYLDQSAIQPILNSHQNPFKTLLIIEMSNGCVHKNTLRNHIDLFKLVTGLDAIDLGVLNYFYHESPQTRKAILSANLATINQHINTDGNRYSNYLEQVLSNLTLESSLTLHELSFILNKSVVHSEIRSLSTSLYPKLYQTLREKETKTLINRIVPLTLATRLKSGFTSTELIYIESFLRTYRYNAKDNNFEMIINSFYDYLMKVKHIIKSKKITPGDRYLWQKILVNDGLNSYIIKILHTDNDHLPFLNKHEYYSYEYQPVYIGRNINISLAYTKKTIHNSIIPIINKYEKIKGIISNLNVSSSSLDKLKNISLHNYTSNYITAYNNVLRDIYGKHIPLQNLQLFIMSVIANNSPFYNMIKFVKDNTSFKPSKKYIFVNDINDKFVQLSKFVDSKDFNIYKSLLSEVSSDLYTGDTSIDNQLLTQINSHQPGSVGFQLMHSISPLMSKNLSSYDLFEAPIIIAKNSLTSYLVSKLIPHWNRDIKIPYDTLQRSFPFSLYSTHQISYQWINDHFGKRGTTYMAMKLALKPFLNINQNHWVFKKYITAQNRKILEPQIREFNYVQDIQNLLWNEQGNAIPIRVSIQPQPFARYAQSRKIKMLLDYLQLGPKQKALSLNSDVLHKSTLMYDWYNTPSATVGWMSSHNMAFQNTYQGEWSMFKLLRAATCDHGWMCRWNTSEHLNNSHDYLLRYKISGYFLHLIH